MHLSRVALLCVVFMCVCLMGSPGVRTYWFIKNLNWRRMQREVRKFNCAIPRYIGGTTDASDPNFNFLHVPLRTLRRFITKTFQRSCTKYLIASGKLLVATVLARVARSMVSANQC